MKEEIIEIIKEISNTEFDDYNIDLIESNILDSLAFIELINELEERFDIEIQPTQVDKDVWRSIDKIVKLCEEKL